LLNDPDTYLHVAAGRWMLAHFALPVRDPFSHSLAGATWVPHEWLAEVALAAVYRAAGWSGLVLLGAASFGATIALRLWWHSPRGSGGQHRDLLEGRFIDYRILNRAQ
jgi:hypothetical protein